MKLWPRHTPDPPPVPPPPPSRWATCPECGSTRHTRVFEETSDGGVTTGYHCRACGAQWADQPDADQGNEHEQPVSPWPGSSRARARDTSPTSTGAG